MSLYNMLFGMNTPLAIFLSIVLKRKVDDIPRFRDCFLKADDCPVDDYDFLIYTRMGGGNYECWGNDDGEYHKEDCNCPYCRLLKIEEEDWYICGYDDDFDNTYRTLVGKFTEEQRKLFEKLKTMSVKEIKELYINLFPETVKEQEQ